MSQVEVDEDTSELIRENGAFRRVSGKREIAQHTRCRLRQILGEVFLDKTKGVDWELVFSKGGELSEVTGMFRRIIDDTPGVGDVADVIPTQDGPTDKANRIVNFSWNGTYSLELLQEEGPLHDDFVVRT